MFCIFLFMRYLRRTLNYLKSITLFYLIHMMRMTDLIAIGVETLRIDKPHNFYQIGSSIIGLDILNI